MAPKTITVKDANGRERWKRLSTQEGYKHLLSEFGVAFLKDGGGVEIEDFESLVGGGKYTLGESEQPALVQELRTKLTVRDRLGKGTFFAQMKDVIERETIPFEGGFEAICARFADKTWRKSRFQAYNNLVTELENKVSDADVLAEALTLESESVSNQSLGTKSDLSREEKDVKSNRERDMVLKKQQRSNANAHRADPSFNAGVCLIESGTETNTAHLLAGNVTCSPTVGILAQPIVGKDFEAAMDKQIKTVEGRENVEDKSGKVKALQAKKIKILQQLAYHKRDPYKGFINLENNWVQVPKQGHETFFDEGCNWIIVPVMPLEDILGWHHGKGEYWVMFIAGNLTETDYSAYRNLLQASQSEKDGEDVYVEGEREQCSEDEVRNGIKNLRAFVCALADLATGRGENKLTPFDLILEDKKPRELGDLMAARDELQTKKTVIVPKLKEISFENNGPEILKLRIRHNFDTSKLTEPMAFAAKGALNFMSLTGQKATPACRKRNGDEEDSDEETASLL